MIDKNDNRVSYEPKFTEHVIGQKNYQGPVHIENIQEKVALATILIETTYSLLAYCS